MSKKEVIAENEGVNMPVAYEQEGQITVKEKAASFKESHPKLMKGLKIGGIGLLLALFGAGCYKLGSRKSTDEENDDYYIDLDELEAQQDKTEEE
jgi:hypothetical protein